MAFIAVNIAQWSSCTRNFDGHVAATQVYCNLFSHFRVQFLNTYVRDYVHGTFPISSQSGTMLHYYSKNFLCKKTNLFLP